MGGTAGAKETVTPIGIILFFWVEAIEEYLNCPFQSVELWGRL